MKTFKPGDRVIWDRGFNYEIGTCKVMYGETTLLILNRIPLTAKPKSGSLYPYTTQKINEMALKYGYRKQFE